MVSHKVSNDCDDIVTNLFWIYGVLFCEAVFKENNIIITIILVYLSFGYQFCFVVPIQFLYRWTMLRDSSKISLFSS